MLKSHYLSINFLLYVFTGKLSTLTSKLSVSSTYFLCGFVCACVLGLSVCSILLALITFASIFLLFILPKSHEPKLKSVITKGSVHDDLTIKGGGSVETKSKGHTLQHQAKCNQASHVRKAVEVEDEDTEQDSQDGKAWLDDVVAGLALHQETMPSYSDGIPSSENEKDVCRVFKRSNIKPLPPLLLPQKEKEVTENHHDQSDRVLNSMQFASEAVVPMPSHTTNLRNDFHQPSNTLTAQGYKSRYSMISLQHVGTVTNVKKASRKKLNSVGLGSWRKYGAVYRRKLFPATNIYHQKIDNKKRRPITRSNIQERVLALKQMHALTASTRQHPQVTRIYPRRGSRFRKKKDIHRLSTNIQACTQSPIKLRRNLQTPPICPQNQHQAHPQPKKQQLANHGCGQEKEDSSVIGSSEVKPLSSHNQPSDADDNAHMTQSRLRYQFILINDFLKVYTK